MFNWLSDLVKSVNDAGLSKVIYNIFFFGGFVGLTTYNLIVSKKYGFSKAKALLYTVIVYVLSVAMMFFLYWSETGFNRFGGNNIVRVFIWVPVFAYPAAKLLKIDWRKGCDFISPCVCINHGIAHLGCIFEGCCHGYRWENGVFNPQMVNHAKTFPNQPIEAIIALLIAFYIARREWKKGYKTDGLSIPIMLMLFGYTRFLLEFARDNVKLFWGIFGLAIHALICGIVGTLMYILIKKRSDEKSSFSSGKLAVISSDKWIVIGIVALAVIIEAAIIIIKGSMNLLY